jgi:hypothetical protein
MCCPALQAQGLLSFTRHNHGTHMHNQATSMQQGMSVPLSYVERKRQLVRVPAEQLNFNMHGTTKFHAFMQKKCPEHQQDSEKAILTASSKKAQQRGNRFSTNIVTLWAQF